MDHHIPERFKTAVDQRMPQFFCGYRDAFGTDADYFYGPYFITYREGSFFKAHRNVADHKNDHRRLAAHRWSLPLYLKSCEADQDLPTFDGGTVVVYETDAKLPTAAS